MMNRRKCAVDTILSPVIVISEFRAALVPRDTKLSVPAPLTIASLVSAAELTV